MNNGLLDTYQLKSLDGLLEASVEDMILKKKDGRLYVQLSWEENNFTSDSDAQILTKNMAHLDDSILSSSYNSKSERIQMEKSSK